MWTAESPIGSELDSSLRTALPELSLRLRPPAPAPPCAAAGAGARRQQVGASQPLRPRRRKPLCLRGPVEHARAGRAAGAWLGGGGGYSGNRGGPGCCWGRRRGSGGSGGGGGGASSSCRRPLQAAGEVVFARGRAASGHVAAARGAGAGGSGGRGRRRPAGQGSDGGVAAAAANLLPPAPAARCIGSARDAPVPAVGLALEALNSATAEQPARGELPVQFQMDECTAVLFYRSLH